MKKFIIAICGILIVGNAFAAPDRYREPKKSPYADRYLSMSSSPYTVSITDFYPKLSEQIGRKYPTQNGTYRDEGAIVIWAARDIYEHGVSVCPVQIQTANQNSRRYTWIDYHWKDEWGCKSFCDDGYSGNKCNDVSLVCPNTNTISTGKYYKDRPISITATHQYLLQNLPDLIDGRPGDDYQHTKEMRVLDYANEKIADGGDTNEKRQANHIVLGVIGRVLNGVFVGPIKVIGERTPVGGGGIASFIVSAYSNGDKVLMCADGYVSNRNNTECVKDPQCDDPSAIAMQNWDWCSNYAIGFNEEQHAIKPNLSKKCNEYRCIADNYGFKSSTDHTCVPCGTDAKSGILDGECTTCKTGQIFTTSGCSDKVTSYTKEQMFKNSTNQCWLKIDPDEFCECVTGEECKR